VTGENHIVFRKAGRDEHQRVNAGEAISQRVRFVEVDTPGGGPDGAAACHDLQAGDGGEPVKYQSAERAGCTGDENHEIPLTWFCSVTSPTIATSSPARKEALLCQSGTLP